MHSHFDTTGVKFLAILIITAHKTELRLTRFGHARKSTGVIQYLVNSAS